MTREMGEVEEEEAEERSFGIRDESEGKDLKGNNADSRRLKNVDPTDRPSDRLL